jgi:cytochrome P450
MTSTETRRVHEKRIEEMEPAMRALVAYEPNGSLDVVQPQPMLAAMARETPVVRSEAGVAFFGMADVVTAARNPAIVSCDPATGRPVGMGTTDPLIPLHLDGDMHRRYRRLLDPLLAPRVVAQLADDIRRLADELIDEFAGEGEVEFNSAFAQPLPSTLFLRTFGLPVEDFAFLDHAKDQIIKNEGATFEEYIEIGNEAGRAFREYMHARLAERREQPLHDDDMLGKFMTFEVDGHVLNDDEIANIMHLFVIAGLDTVTSSLTCIVSWFARHAEQRARVVAKPSLLPAAVEELMRYESPVASGGLRWAKEETDVNGVRVKRGEMVYLGWFTANLDETTFPDPLTVDLGREENRHIAFAAGTHRCLGSHLARVELVTAIDQLHRRIPDYWMTPGDEPRYQGTPVRQAIHLPLRFRT